MYIVLVSEPLPARHFPSIATVANQQATRLPLAPVEKSIHHHFNFALTPVWPRIRWGVQIVACSLDCGSRASIIPLPAALRLAVRLRHSSAGTTFIPWASSLFCCICILPYLFLPSSHPLGPLWILYFFFTLIRRERQSGICANHMHDPSLSASQVPFVPAARPSYKARY